MVKSPAIITWLFVLTASAQTGPFGSWVGAKVPSRERFGLRRAMYGRVAPLYCWKVPPIIIFPLPSVNSASELLMPPLAPVPGLKLVSIGPLGVARAIQLRAVPL